MFLAVLVGAAVAAVPPVKTFLPRLTFLGCQGSTARGDAASYPGELHDQQPHSALCQSPHLPDRIKELKPHHSISCHHDVQHLHTHTPLDQKNIFFSLTSDFPCPKPSCISRLIPLTTPTSPLCCPAPPKALGRLDPQSQG